MTANRHHGVDQVIIPQLAKARALMDAGDLAAVQRICQQLLHVSPGDWRVLHMLALLALRSGKAAEAISLLLTALQRGRSAILHSDLAVALMSVGRSADAISHFRASASLAPDSPDAHHNLGLALQLTGDLAGAEASFLRAVQVAPQRWQGWAALAHVRQLRGLFAEALADYRRVLLAVPNDGRIHYNTGLVLHELGRIDEAVTCYQQALAFMPPFEELLRSLGAAQMSLGLIDDAIATLQQAMTVAPNSLAVRNDLLMALHYTPAWTPERIFAAFEQFGQDFDAPRASLQSHSRENGPRLRLGYVSADLHRHSVAFFIEPIFKHHNHGRFEIFCYYNNDIEDEVSARLRSLADHWVPCRHLSDEQLTARIAADGIQVLVDMSGHTKGNRLGVFARKPAPVQVTWMGFPATTGLKTMDYRLTDAWMDPPGLTDRFHTERLVRLRMSAIFQPSPLAPEVNRLPALSSAVFVLACLNSVSKLNAFLVEVWSQLLHRMPHAQLWLASGNQHSAASRVAGWFASFGIDSRRLRFLPVMPLEQFLALHHQIDVALDAFPFNGGTTTCHSLWMGVPVVTLAGQTSASRQGSAILHGVGLGDWVTETSEAYIERVERAAADLGGLDQLRQNLRCQIRASGESDPAKYTGLLEATFQSLWLAARDAGHVGAL